MKNKKIYYGTKEEWLNENYYIVDNVYDDNFAINFEGISIKERIEKGGKIEEPKFEELVF